MTSPQRLPHWFVLALLALFPVATAQGAATSTATTATPVVETLVDASASWNGAPLPAYPDGQPEVRLLRITIPAGYQLGMHMHPVINVGYLLEGTLTVITETGERNELLAGDTIVEVVDTWHYGVNEGTVPAVILVFYAGTTDLPITIDEAP